MNVQGLTLRGPNAGIALGDQRGDEAISGFTLQAVGNGNRVRLAEGADNATISSNELLGSGRGNNRARGVINVGKADVTATIRDNTFMGLRTGTFSDSAGAVYSVVDNDFIGNDAGSSDSGTGAIYRGNSYSGNEEGIGLAGNDITIEGNTFVDNDANVVYYLGNSDLDEIFDLNDFPEKSRVEGNEIVTE